MRSIIETPARRTGKLVSDYMEELLAIPHEHSSKNLALLNGPESPDCTDQSGLKTPVADYLLHPDANRQITGVSYLSGNQPHHRFQLPNSLDAKSP
ncbi:hypothetical protein G6M84_11550 [Agrobacterium tumefaciens]|uniref:hypothetical protein n=1 Tax=Agrobacterium tumefaciens TaxID=358 RepID=UPI001572B1E1|nr:hypothetical protein [Agrobacterium tumefaciens]NTB97151.1 hypothetical protein [Agrobacterium tumefaciens]NTC47645.1 hypothetical protein [Agrobacterium tumefaciens]